MNRALKAMKASVAVLTIALVIGLFALGMGMSRDKRPEASAPDRAPESTVKPASIAGCGEFLCVLMNDGAIYVVRPQEGRMRLGQRRD
ncbi:hypothetical protein FACS1894186_3470 [Alphaproteobacteria bacterium]|nr:hypothetical protein FACS1894186_3470 [Alphaproteobacteria bacterium]